MNKLINYIKQKKYTLAFSIIFSVMLFLSYKIIFLNGVFSNNEEIYFEGFSFFDFIYYIIINIITFIICDIIFNKIKESKLGIEETREVKRKNIIKLFLSSTALMIICWLPYILSYMPGGVYVDTYASILMATNLGTINNHHPILYTLTWKLFLIIANIFNQNINFAIGAFTIVQCLAMIVCFSSFICWLYSKKIKKIYIIFTFIFYAFYPLIPIYGVSLWKDTPFSIYLFMYSFLILDLVFDNNINEKLNKKSRFILYMLLTFLVAFGRNNGIYIIIATSLCLIIYLFIKNKENKKTNIVFSIVSSIIIIISIVIQGPIYNGLKFNIDEKTEKYGIPIQQVAYIITNDGNVSDDELDFFDKIMNVDSIKREYRPCIVDTLKYSEEFDDGFFKENSSEFVQKYISVVLKNPVMAIKGFLLANLGIWDINKSTADGYISCSTWDGVPFEQTDIFENIFEQSIRNHISNYPVISQSLFTWIIIFCIFNILNKGNKRLILPLIPCIILVGTLMIATPIAFSFRYVFSTLLVMPIAIVCVLGKKENKKTTIEK